METQGVQELNFKTCEMTTSKHFQAKKVEVKKEDEKSAEIKTEKGEEAEEPAAGLVTSSIYFCLLFVK